MGLDAVNRERLFAQARKMDRLSTVYFEQFIPSYTNVLYRVSPSFLRVNVLFKESAEEVDQTEIAHGSEYVTQLSKILFGSGINVKSTEVSPGIISVEIDKPLTTQKEEANIFLYQVMKPRTIQFSKGISVLPIDESGEPIYKSALFLGDKDYVQYLPKIPDPPKIFTPKTLYRGRTTYEVVHYFTDREKEIIKKQLYEILAEHGVRLTIFDECENREVAYEKLTPPGEEEQQHWRVKLGDFDWLKSEITKPFDLEKTLELYDWLGVYPKLKQNVKTEEGALELQTRMVLEIDPRESELQYTGFIFDKLTEVVKNLRLPFRRFHSGSLSSRIHIEIDAEDILKNALSICKKYSFIGAGFNKPIKSLEDVYKVIIRAVEDSIFLYLWNKSKFSGIPKITKNKFSPEYGLCLFDSPKTVSIAAGSAKKVIRIDGKTGKILESLDEKYRKIPVTVSMCTPLRENEAAPKTLKQIIEICSPLSAIERLNDMYPTLNRKIEERMTSVHVEDILNKTPRRQFKVLRSNENMFRKEYSKP